ncbi:MAG: leucine-rich repeat protein [Oscillospiraceae bacterium]|nr:leucine-rich repeat protein [Oscillospiraceae bacterium]
MRSKTFRLAAASALALLIVAGGAVIQPVGDIVGTTAVSVSAETTTGQWNGVSGSGTWTYDSDNKVLTFEGTGTMDQVYNAEATTWTSYALQAKTVEIQGGITGVGDRVFSGCSNIEWVSIGSSVVEIGSSAFSNCGSLVHVAFAEDTSSHTL